MYVAAKLSLTMLLVGLLGTVSAHTSTPMQEATPQQSTVPESNNGQETSPATPQSSPNPDSSGVYHPGKGVTPPQVIHSAYPEYPDSARREKVDGVCIVAILVDVNGIPKDVHVVRSIESSVDPEFRSAAKDMDKNAVKTASKFRFKPATYHGQPVPIAIKLEINYRISY